MVAIERVYELGYGSKCMCAWVDVWKVCMSEWVYGSE